MENAKRGGLTLENDKLTMTAVSKIISNNEKSINLVQGGENVSITGDGLSISELNVESGTLSAKGRVKEIRFSASFDKKNFLGKIFR